MAPDAAAAPPALVLASTSRYRQELLARLGVPFEAIAPTCDEEAIRDPRWSAQELAEARAAAKAASIAARHPERIVIGSDQVLALGDRILGKPGTRAAACAQLAELSGRTHRLLTAMTVVHRSVVRRHTAIADVTLRRLQPAQIARYVARDEPIDCAGSYKLERGGIALIERIRTDDHSAITGLPLLALIGILEDFGVVLP